MKIFESGLYSLVEWLINIFLLNLLIILTSIPIITIFPSLSAGFNVVRNWKLNRDPSVTRAYFRYLGITIKENKLMHVTWFVASFIIFINYFYLMQDETSMVSIMYVPLFVTTVLFIGVSVHLLGLTAHYKLTFNDKIKLATRLTLTRPHTGLLVLMNALLFIAFFVLPLLFLVLFSFGVYLNFSICHHIYWHLKTSPQINEN